MFFTDRINTLEALFRVRAAIFGKKLQVFEGRDGVMSLLQESLDVQTNERDYQGALDLVKPLMKWPKIIRLFLTIPLNIFRFLAEWNAPFTGIILNPCQIG